MRKLLIVAVAALAATGCKKAEETGGGAASLTVTVDVPQIIANGVNTVTVTVSGASSGPITVTTTKGTFVSSGSATGTIAGTSGTLDLLTCDSQSNPLCGGTAAISASGGGRTGFASVRFLKIENCSNLVDDDGDGSKDCADADCTGNACVLGGVAGTCLSGTCTCTATGTSETVCGDGEDDDCDGDVDCADADCTGVACTATGGGIGACTVAGVCTCTPAGATETTCGDSKDNDCDGTVDCMDANCAGLACAAGGTCSGTSCTPASCTPTPGQAAAETDCGDAVDNDCDGNIDCVDSNCDTRQCDALPSQICSSQSCTDIAQGISLEVKPLHTRLAADGVSTTTVSITMTRDDVPVSQAIQFAALPAGLGSLSTNTVTTDATGKATVTYTAGATGGIATLTANPFGIPYYATATIELEAIGELSVLNVQFPIMGIRGSGYQEVNLVEVQVKDLNFALFPAGLEVVFEHQSLGGSTISGPWVDTATCQQANDCYAYHAVTDANGVARVSLYSGSLTGPLSLSAVATAGGPTRTLQIANRIAVVGARASGSSFSIVCSPSNIRALQNTDCGRSLVDDPFTCVALLQDRYGNMLGAATQVMFMAESSRVGQIATTPKYDPAKKPADQADLGSAVETFGTLGGFLPEDVTPRAGEPAVDHGADGCGVRTHNPRDGVVTVVAIADGEEAFFDSNGNGSYDAGEPYVDLPEPFVDSDDDGLHDGSGPNDDNSDGGEWFLDVNGNGYWDPPNGSWTSDTKIFTQTVVVFTGAPIGPVETSPGSGLYLGSRAHGPFYPGNYAPPFDLPYTPVSACTPTPAAGDFDIHPVGADPTTPDLAAYQLIGQEGNFNQLADAAQYNWYMLEPANAVSYYMGLGFVWDSPGLFYTYWPCDVATGICRTRCTTGRCVMKPEVSGYGCGYSTRSDISGYVQDPDTWVSAVWWIGLTPNELPVTVSGDNMP